MPVYILGLFAAISVYIFNVPGIEGWYMDFWWYDIFMHILGGFAIGLLVISGRSLFSKKKINFPYVLLTAFAVGLGWEYFEIYFNLIGHPLGSNQYYIDTIIDLIDDMIGAALALSVARSFLKRGNITVPIK